MTLLLGVMGVLLVVVGLIWRSKQMVGASGGASSAMARRRGQNKPPRSAASTPWRSALRAAGIDVGPGRSRTAAVAEAQRRSDRILLKIPVEVSGSNLEGNPFTERTSTQVVNRNGGTVILKNSILPDCQLTVKNLQTGQSCKFRARSRMHDLPGGLSEWGVECMDPAPAFWGILFEDSSPGAEKEAFGSLLECSGCHCREMANLSVSDYRAMVQENLSLRHCVWCGKETPWKFAVVVAEPESSTSPTLRAQVVTTPDGSGVERRREERRIARMPISIRHADGRDEFTTTENVSRSGICCAASMQLVVGENVFLSLVSDHVPGAAEFRAQVKWSRKISDKRNLYGMKMERDQPNPA